MVSYFYFYLKNQFSEQIIWFFKVELTGYLFVPQI